MQRGPSKNGYKWEFAGGAQPIDNDSPVVHVVNMSDRRSENYILALVHDQVSDVEVPVPLGWCRHFGFGCNTLIRVLVDVIHIWDKEDEDKWCCRPLCGDLRAHLKFHWSKRVVIKATRFEEPFTSVLSTAFDTSEFPPRTNNLYLRWEPETPI
jgi:hypothetical protein